MMALEIVENNTNRVLARFPVSVPDPEPLFVKDRKTKQRYVMIRTRCSSPESPRQLFDTVYDQYSPVFFRFANIL